MVMEWPNMLPGDPGTEPVHSESESYSWSINVPDHPARRDSPEYVAARREMNEIAAEATGLVYGPPPFKDHHGGGLWLKDSQGWFLVRNLAGIEWSAQFCADPAKVDLLRQNAKRLYDLVAPEITQELDPGGLLDTPIQDASGVARWTDSIFNVGVPLQPSYYTGVHRYPTPVVDIQLFKYDDFQLWVTDDQGNPAAVAPVSPRGSGDAKVHVLYATPGSALAQQKQAAESANTPLILGPDHPLSQQAFQNQV